jgi:uncharacterized membrane protein
MNLRLAIMELTARYQLSAGDSARLSELAGVHQQPRRLMQLAPAGLAVIAAVLGGLGIIFWIAANWESVTRVSRFTLLEGFFAVMCLGALLRPAARVPLGLVAFLATGGLFAFFGQTYQTGADPWQLFAWWAALTLPLCFGIRHDAIWTAWAIVAMTALGLWSRAEGGYAWAAGIGLPLPRLLHWFGALLPAIALSPKFRKYTGAGIWPLRVCVLLATSLIAADALKPIFHWDSWTLYFLGLALLAAVFAAFCRTVMFDIFAVCVLALGLNVLIYLGIVVLAKNLHGISGLLVIGLSAAGLLGATVKGILTISRTGGVKWSTQ